MRRRPAGRRGRRRAETLRKLLADEVAGAGRARALKSVGLAAAMNAALIARGVADPTAHLAAELGVLAFKRGYTQWSEGDHEDSVGLAHHALAALADLRTATASLG